MEQGNCPVCAVLMDDTKSNIEPTWSDRHDDIVCWWCATHNDGDAKRPVGAWGIARWSDTGEEKQVYFSFGEYNEETDCDTFGVHDSKIFFYCLDEKELQSFMIGYDEHVTLISYEIQYDEIGGKK